MGLFTSAMGIQMFMKTGNPLIVLGSLLIGTLLGEWLRIDSSRDQRAREGLAPRQIDRLAQLSLRLLF